MRERRIALVIGFVVIVSIVAGILISRDGSGGGDERTSAVEGCTLVKAPASPATRPKLSPPARTVPRGEKLTATFETSCGAFAVALDTARAPRTVSSFVSLARRGFYDGLTFHRIAPGSVIQGGDPNGDGTGGPGYTITERPPINLSYTKGVVAMGKTSVEPPGTSGSQFFIVLGADAGLPPDYALLGRLSGGFATVARIGRLGTPSQMPKQTVLIDRVSIEGG